MMRILHLDENHPILVEQLAVLGFENSVDTQSSKEVVAQVVFQGKFFFTFYLGIKTSLSLLV